MLHRLLTFFCLYSTVYFSQSPTSYVNPFIGTGGHGHTFPGPVLPFGMVQLSPDTRIDKSWDACGGYHYSDSVIYGFSHTHLSGVGVNDYGDVLLMPQLQRNKFNPENYLSGFSHLNETASPGFYSVKLNTGITAELTSTARVGVHKYLFPKDSSPKLLVDLLHRDKLLKGELKQIDSVTLVGYRISEAWAKEQPCYFAIHFSQPIKSVQYAHNRQKINSAESADACFIEFKSKANEALLVKTAISFVDANGALNNLKNEAPHWDFERYKREANNIWNEQLSKLIVESNDKNRLTTFYTALYHCFIHPSVFQDVDGRYLGRDKKIHTTQNRNQYTVFSLWDTYRTLHPLFNIVAPKRNTDFINTFVAQFKQSGRLPMWELCAEETDCMIGFHSVSVIADVFAKNNSGFDTSVIYDAMRASAQYPKFGLECFNKKGYLQVNDESESVSKTLEYAYDHWCIAQVAKFLKKEKDYHYHIKLALGYRTLFDPTTGFMRPRENGNWLTPFDAKQINNHFTEGNGWHYNFAVPFDVEGLIRLHGGEKKFEQKLDELFSTDSKTTGRDQVDVTGLIGQYAHGNEPSHHMAYLYNYIGKPQKTIQRVHQILNTFYKNEPDGLIGNDDCGQLSAWYVMSAIGLYPVCPGSDEYVLGQPIFDKVSIQLENGNTFLITNTAKHKERVSGYLLNGKEAFRSALNHSALLAGGNIVWQYAANKDSSKLSYGKALSMRPTSRVTDFSLLPAPIINSNGKLITEPTAIKISMPSKLPVKIVYTLDGSDPNQHSRIYTKPILISKTCTLKVKAFSKTDSSAYNEAHFTRSFKNFSVTITSNYNKQYSAGGPQGLVDSIFGDSDWRKGGWQGYQSQDLECVVDLKKQTSVRYVGAHFLQDTRSWIMYPTKVNYYFSKDGKTWVLQESVENTIKPDDYTIQTQWLEKQLPKPEMARYVKIVATNFGPLPLWHEGYSMKGDAFIFIDEIDIR
jgi:predicted alpha-1,2-mannosidase